ncbi:MAG: DUF4878 domain-containing protein [Candidatus Dadabacteria bacterium]|nr:DUF4878 domain-containing protein [Candidatus Dadabacteria bacterium]
MKLLTVILMSVCFLSGGGAAAYAEDAVQGTAEGSLTANDKTYQMKYSYADEGPDDIILVITDSELKSEDVPFGLHQLAMEGKVHGLVVTISKETKGQAPGLNALYDESWGGQLGTLGNAVLKIDKLDDKTIEGQISTPEKSAFSDYTFAIDVKFKTALGAPKQAAPVEVTVKGDGSPAAAAYADYYKALMGGDIPTVKKLIIKKNAEQLDDETAGMIVDMAQSFHPKEIEIVTVNASGSSAELKVTGSSDGSQGTGTIEMTVEDGQWKVVTDKWKFQD